MFLYGVVNASPDSLNADSIVAGPEQALARARRLLADGADGLDLGGQGSTDAATVVAWEAEWERLRDVVPALATLGVPMSVDTWRPEVLRRALQAGATVINAADGMQSDEMWQVATEFDVPIVVPFLSGPNPRAMEMVQRDPVEAIIEFFDARLRDADRYGLRTRCVLDPGTCTRSGSTATSTRCACSACRCTSRCRGRRPLSTTSCWRSSSATTPSSGACTTPRRCDRSSVALPASRSRRIQRTSGPRAWISLGGSVASQSGGHSCGASSLSGASTKRRSKMRGCGTVSASLVMLMSS